MVESADKERFNNVLNARNARNAIMAKPVVACWMSMAHNVRKKTGC